MNYVRHLFLLLVLVGTLAIVIGNVDSTCASLGLEEYDENPEVENNRVRADLVVRPDVLAIDFSVIEKDFPSSKAKVKAIEEKIRSSLGKKTTLSTKMTDIKMLYTRNKRRRPDRFKGWQISGVFFLELRQESDFWERAHVYALAESALLELTAAHAQKDEDAIERVGFGKLRPEVRHPEKYRNKLLQQWTDNARQLIAAAQSDKAPLYIQQCAMPDDISQTAFSLEQVTLSLDISCRIDVLQAAVQKK